MQLSHLDKHSAKGFSLVEMLVVLAVVGIITAIAIVPFTAITKERTDQARDRRNAQNIVSMAQAASAAGLIVIVPGDLATTVNNIVTGGTSTEGVFSGTNFSLEGMGDDMKLRAMVYLELEGGMLTYNPDF